MLPPGSGAAMLRVAAVVPAVLIVLFTGVLWLLGLVCNGDRRRYVTELSNQAMGVVGQILRGPEIASPPPRVPRPRQPAL